MFTLYVHEPACVIFALPDFSIFTDNSQSHFANPVHIL